MGALNAFLNQVFAALWTPFAGLTPWAGLTVLSVLVGILALLGMKYCSNQARIAVLKDRYKAHVLAIRLFRDDLWIVVLSMVRTLGQVSCYLGHQLRPMLILIVPIVLLFAQMQMRLAYQPLALGEKVLVKVELVQERKADVAGVEPVLPPGVELAGAVVPVPAEGLLVVPVRATQPGAHELRFRLGGEEVVKSLHAGDLGSLESLAPVRSSGFADLLLYPTEPAFGAASAFARIQVPYGTKSLELFGVDWSFGIELGMGIVFLVISMVAAFALKGLFGVTL